MALGDRKGTRVVLKAYPRPTAGGYDVADALATNELSAHCDLQVVIEANWMSSIQFLFASCHSAFLDTSITCRNSLSPYFYGEF